MKTQKSSIAHQKNFFEGYIGERGWELYRIYEDVESGMSVKKREGLRELIEDSRKGLFDVLLTKSISRFARNTLEGLTHIRELKKIGIRFITIEDAFDSFEYDEFMFTLLLSMAQKESERISERIKFGKIQRAKRGLYNGSNPPYGYKKDGKNHLLIADDITTEVVRIIFKMYNEGLGFYKIAKYLNEQGYPTPSMIAKKINSNKLWHQSTVKNILTNEVYVGNLVQNKSRGKDLLNGTREANVEEEYIRVENTHEAIIDINTFKLAEKILKQRGGKRTSKSKYTFTGILYCGECGSGMHYKKNKTSYICGKLNKWGKKYCKGSHINKNSLKIKIEKNLGNLIRKGVDLNRLNTKLRKTMDKAKRNDGLNCIHREMQNMTKKQIRLLDVYVEGMITMEEYNEKNTAIRNQILLLQNKKNRLELELSANGQNNINSYNELCGYIKLDSVVVNKLIKKITVYNDEKVLVEYDFKRIQGLEE
ncbi:recombinase family protein [Wukongibacter baidiensis]|uniref:recombinase family protein n=1 Tax=Wukongibacter baidiensis TaxID=1723361 RepID=UPI003D7FAAD1